jgi:hypothetical protein
MNNTDSQIEKKGDSIYIGNDGILRTTIGASLTEEEVEKLINDALDLSQKKGGRTKVLVNFLAAPHIPSVIFRKKIVKSIKEALKEVKNWKIATYGGGTIQKTVASFVASASGLKNIKFFKSETEALEWLKRE